MESGERRKFCFTNDNGFTALFVGLGVIGEQADADIGIGLDIKLAAQHVAIAVIAFDAAGGFQITIAFTPRT